MRKFRPATLGLVLLAAACSGIKTEAPTAQQTNADLRDIYKNGSLLGNEGGITLFGGNKGNGQGQATGIGVNGFLWRASLEVLHFMPITSADPFGGVILTDWYAPPETPNERFKINLYILDRQLRADGLKFSVFRQTRANGSDWQDAAVQPDTARKLEDEILTKARELRIAQTSTQ